MHSADDGSWLAYAQWPNRESWENHADTLGVALAQSRQVDCLSGPVKVLARLTVTDDLLQSGPYSGEPKQEPEAVFVDTIPKLRVARPTDQMPDIVRFYKEGLGLNVLGGFENHEGFDGVMLGTPDILYHLEFTHCHSHSAGKAPTQDNLLIFYIPDKGQWHSAVQRMQSLGYQPVQSFNPYWDKCGCTFEDADGYRVVLQNAQWPS
jgi:catechol 2,3-dioxygenase-like lactoylglutathione lyase family enzyme